MAKGNPWYDSESMYLPGGKGWSSKAVTGARREFDQKMAADTKRAFDNFGPGASDTLAAIGKARAMFNPESWLNTKKFQDYWGNHGGIMGTSQQKALTEKYQNATDKETGNPKFVQESGTNDGGVFSKATTQESVDRALAQRQKRFETMLAGMVY
jgi:hypothetical protein